MAVGVVRASTGSRVEKLAGNVSEMDLAVVFILELDEATATAAIT